jgi:signal transduction histidine kinase
MHSKTNMKRTTLSRLSGEYLAALRVCLEQVPPGDVQAAHEMGVNAVAMGLETLDLAKIHNQAVTALLSPHEDAAVWEHVTVRAALFFVEAITPIEKTHRLALEAGADLEQVSTALARRTLDLAESNRELQEGIARREDADECLRASEEQSVRLLEEARRLQRHLQELAREIMTAQEEERKRLSLTLQDEIAQTLLAIHVRLLALDRELAISAEGFKKEIATTQRLVQESVQTISRFARECGTQHEA